MASNQPTSSQSTLAPDVQQDDAMEVKPPPQVPQTAKWLLVDTNGAEMQDPKQGELPGPDPSLAAVCHQRILFTKLHPLVVLINPLINDGTQFTINGRTKTWGSIKEKMANIADLYGITHETYTANSKAKTETSLSKTWIIAFNTS